jgi:hypothetical protein
LEARTSAIITVVKAPEIKMLVGVLGIDCEVEANYVPRSVRDTGIMSGNRGFKNACKEGPNVKGLRSNRCDPDEGRRVADFIVFLNNYVELVRADWYWIPE